MDVASTQEILSQNVWNICTSSLCCVVLVYTGLLYSSSCVVGSVIVSWTVCGEIIKLYTGPLPVWQAIWRVDRVSSSVTTSRRVVFGRDLLTCMLELLASCVVFFVLCVLLGAEVTAHHEETALLSITLTALAVLPACLHLGPATTRSLLCGASPAPASRDLYYRSVASVMGAWLGAFVIPLDWDRAWQRWPLPCVVGALVGSATYSAAQLVTLSWGTPKQKRTKN